MKDIRVLTLFFAISAAFAIEQCPKENDSSADILLGHNDCDKFYMCTLGRLIEMLCPVGLYFNPKISKCDWKQNVDCRRNDSSDNQTQSENSEALNDYENQSKESYGGTKEDELKLDDSDSMEGTGDHRFFENGCPKNSSLHWLLPHEDNCNLFYYCVHGKKVQTQCASTLHFNFNLQICDWPHNAGCNHSSENDPESEKENSQEDENSQENNNSEEDNNSSQEESNSQEDTNSQENDKSQEDNNNSLEESQENNNSQEDYTSEEDNSVEDETAEDDNTDLNFQKTKKIEAIVKVNLKALIF